MLYNTHPRFMFDLSTHYNNLLYYISHINIFPKVANLNGITLKKSLSYRYTHIREEDQLNNTIYNKNFLFFAIRIQKNKIISSINNIQKCFQYFVCAASNYLNIVSYRLLHSGNIVIMQNGYAILYDIVIFSFFPLRKLFTILVKLKILYTISEY